MIKKVIATMLSVLIVLSSFSIIASADSNIANTSIMKTFYVSPSGNDSNSGTIDQPFQTIAKAQQAVQQINSNMTGDIDVYLMGGTYYLKNTLNFGKEDSGTNGYSVKYEAYNSEKPVISGGQPVTGWTKDTDADAPVSGLWKAPLSRNSKLRAMYVNGVRANMTSKVISSKGTYGTYSITAGQADWAWVSGSGCQGILFNATDLPATLKNPNNIELLTKTTWNTATVCLSSIANNPSSTDQDIANLQQPYGAIAQDMGWAAFQTGSGTNVTVSNVYEWLNTPGQFYFDQTAQTLYYYPRSGEDMTTANVNVPDLQTVINVKGTPVATGDMTTAGPKTITGQVQNITFSGLTIEDSDYNLCKVGDSYGQASNQGDISVTAFSHGYDWHHDMYRDYDDLPAAVEINDAINVNMFGCTVQHTGAVGISMQNDVTNGTFKGNFINDIGGSGFELSNPQQVYVNDSLQPDIYVYKQNGVVAGAPASKEKYQNGTEAVPKNITIDNNYMLNNCDDSSLWGGNAIESFFTDSLTITHNEIYNTPYGAISVGWGWWNFDGGTPCGSPSGNNCILPGYPTVTSQNNKIDYNRIENTVMILQDCGGIYTLGNQGGAGGKNRSEIIGNFVNCSQTPAKVDGTKVNGIHPDEGSAYIDIKDNVLTNIRQHVLELNDWNYKHDDPTNNVYSNTSASLTGAPNCPVTNFYVDSTYTWDPYGYDIVLHSGLEDQYKSMITSDIIAPTEFEFAANVRVNSQQAIDVGGLLPSTDRVWFAPDGTTKFTASDTITTAAGDAKTIMTPKTDGTYKLYILDKSGTVVGKSIHSLYVGQNIANVTDGGHYNPTAANPLILKLNSNYSCTLNGNPVSDGTKITTRGDYSLIATGNFGNNPKTTINFSVAISDANEIIPTSTTVWTGADITLTNGLNDPAKTIWIAPLNTKSFKSDGQTMTSAAGDSTQIKAPTTPGVYSFYVVDSKGNISVSDIILTVLSNKFDSSKIAPVFSDDFESGSLSPDNWTVTSGSGSVSVVTDNTAENGTKVVNLTSNGENAKATLNKSFSDNTLDFDFNVTSATWLNGFFIYDKGIEFTIFPGIANPFWIDYAKVSHYGPATGTLSLNTWYSAEIAVINNVASIKVWKKGTTKPDDWTFSQTLSNIPSTGSVSIEFYGTNMTGLFDNVSVTAQTNTYTVNYISKYEIPTGVVSANGGSTLTAPSDPQKAGYTFTGWYKDYACTTPWNFATDKVTSTMALYAGWRADTTALQALIDNNKGKVQSTYTAASWAAYSTALTAAQQLLTKADVTQDDVSNAIINLQVAISGLIVNSSNIGVSYSSHIQKLGWQKAAANGIISGTTGKSLRLEGLKIDLTGDVPANASIIYQAHVQKLGWQKAVSNGALAGTTGKSLRAEALKITLSGLTGYEVKYRVHVQKLGWQNWQTTKNGTNISDAAISGTTGKSLRIEAVEITVQKSNLN